MNSEPAASQEWTLVQRRELKIDLIGSKPSASGALQEVHQTKDLYVGRYMNSVETNNIVDYIKSEFDIKVVKYVYISKEKSQAKSFKVNLLSNQIEELFTPEKWLEHVRVRAYLIHFHSKKGRLI